MDHETPAWRPSQGEQPADWAQAVIEGRLTLSAAAAVAGVDESQMTAWLKTFVQAGRHAVGRDDQDPAAIDFVLMLAHALHRYGASAVRMEAAMTAVAGRLGLQARWFSTPTAVMASFGPVHRQQTCLIRVEPGELNLEKLALLYDVTSRFVQGRLSLGESALEVDRITTARRRYGVITRTICYGLASAAAAVFFGGNRLEINVALGIGLVVGTINQLFTRERDTAHVAEPVAAATAATLAAAAAHWLGAVDAVITSLAGVITLLPGLGFTTAMTELATNNLASGTARFAGAFLHLIALGIGIAVGTAIGSHWFPGAGEVLRVAWPLPALALAVAVSSLAYSVLLRARPRDTGWILAAGLVAYGGALIGDRLLGAEIGAVLGAFLIGLISNVRARWLDQSAAVTLVPGTLMLVPGSIGMRSVFAMLQHDASSGVMAAFKMVLIAASIVAGTLLANVAFPSKRPL
jgi:uncharacterized membrane protein YjjP (DUF1212 family)